MLMAWNSNSESTVRSIDGIAHATDDASVAYQLRTTWSDEALMLAVTNQDNSAFAVVYDRYVDLVYSTSLRVLGDTQMAEDVTQDVFVRLWRRPETFVAERGRFLSWLMSVARNRAVDELRARGRRRRREADVTGPVDEAHNVMADSDDPLLTAQLHEEQIAVRKALTTLPHEQRTALELAYFGGLTQQEIASALHEP
jgi:RNA polymerase sigma-70 factor (ECF subfamily)